MGRRNLAEYNRLFPDNPFEQTPLVEVPKEFKSLLLELYYELRDLPVNLWEAHLNTKLQRLYSRHKLPL